MAIGGYCGIIHTECSGSCPNSLNPNTFGTVQFSITLLLIAVTSLISFGAFQDRRLFENLLMSPYLARIQGQWYRLVSHAFIHANWPHLLVNMFVLYSFGNYVEVLYGRISAMPAVLTYLVLYFGGAIVASLPSMARHSKDPGYKAVGASGAVSAVLLAEIMLLPTQAVNIMFIPIDIPAWLFGLGYLAYSWYMDKKSGDHVAHDAHFYGAVFGILFSTILHPDLLLHFGSFERSLGL